MSKWWDCQSSLYDSFELNSLNTLLTSAICAASDHRSISMPHTSTSYPNRKKPTPSSRISKSIQRLIGTVFGVVSDTTSPDKLSIDGDEYFEVDGYLCQGCYIDSVLEKEEEEEKETVVVLKKRTDHVEVKKVRATVLERWFAGRRVGMCR